MLHRSVLAGRGKKDLSAVALVTGNVKFTRKYFSTTLILEKSCSG